MSRKHQAIIVIVLSSFCVHLVNTQVTSPWIIFGTRQENDQFLFADCAITNLTEYANETTIKLNNYGNVNETQVRVDVEPGWHVVTWSVGNELDITIMNYHTTQLAVRINVFGFPSTDTNETSVESLDDDLLSTRRIINIADYEGSGGVMVP